MIIVKSKRCSLDKLKKEYPDAVICDVTSHATDDLVRLSPFYPHGGIPVPFSPGWTAMSVEGVWQGLKTFETADIDTAMFRNSTMKDIKRTVRKFGKPLGHRKGVGGQERLGYITARKLIYVPTYRWVLENKAILQVEKIRSLSRDKTVILLDYNTNPDVEDGSSPLSHACLIKAFIDGTYPVYGDDGIKSSVTSIEAKVSVEEEFTPGMKVRHPKFGEGTVKSVDGEKISVSFQEGDKVLLLRMAKLEKL